MPKREKPKRSFTSGSSPTRDRETLIPEFDPEELAKELGDDVQPERKSFMDKLRDLFG